jgi:hypothetical protein
VTRREWLELRIAHLKRRLAGASVPAGFVDHRSERQRDELHRLQRERDEMDCRD